MRRPLLGLAFCFSLGILIEGIVKTGFWVPFLYSVILLSGYCLFIKYQRLSIVLLFGTVVTMGAFRLALSELPPGRVHLLNIIHGSSPWITCEGVIISDPENRSVYRTHSHENEIPRRKTSFILRLESLTQFGHTLRAEGYLKVVVRNSGNQQLKYGDRVKLRGKLSGAPRQKNFYLFDYAQWLRRQGVFHILSVDDSSSVDVVARNQGALLTSIGFKIRSRVNNALKLGLENEPQLSSVLSGMILGYRDDIPAHVSEEFQRTGTFHILAVSGQNLTFIAFIFIIVLRSFGMTKWKCGYVVLPVLILYCASVGWQPGCLRAFWMSVVVIGAWMMIRPFDLLNALSFAALLILIWDPQQLFDVGFQFSFAVVISLIVFTPWIWDKMRKFFDPDPFLIPELISKKHHLWKYGGGGVAQMAVSSLVAWMASLPFTIYYFHTFAPVTVLANLFIVPMATIILSLGLISFLGSFIHPCIALIYNNANFLFLKILLAGIHFFSLIPSGCLYYSLNEPKLEQDEFILHCLEAGNSQSYILQTKDSIYVIDTGNENCSRFITIPYLKALGVNHIDGLILSHADAQHMGGSLNLLANYDLSHVWMNHYDGTSQVSGKLINFMDKEKVPYSKISTNTKINLGYAGTMEILYPRTGMHIKRADESCPVIVIQGRGKSLLLTFDLPADMIKNDFIRDFINQNNGFDVEWIICGFDANNKNLPLDLAKILKAKGIIFSSSVSEKQPIETQDQLLLINTSLKGGVQIQSNPKDGLILINKFNGIIE